MNTVNIPQRILYFFLGLAMSAIFFSGFWMKYGNRIYEYNLLIKEGKETTAIVQKRYQTVRMSAKGKRRTMNNTAISFDGHTETINRNIEENIIHVIYLQNETSIFLIGEKKEGFFVLFHRNTGIYEILLAGVIFFFLGFGGLYVSYKAIVYKKD